MASHYTYRLTSMDESSAKYGLCEVCGKHCSEVWYQAEMRSGSYYGCRSFFGCKDCLIAQRR